MEKHKKFIKRVEDLAKEYDEIIIPKRRKNQFGNYYYSDEYHDIIQEWLVKVENILWLVFNEESIQFRRFINTREHKNVKLPDKLHRIKGLLNACLDDLEKGFIQGQEFIIANEVFDSVLEEAEFYLNQKNKDISALLLRIVLEDSLKRIANKEKIEIVDEKGKKKKASYLNDELKRKNYYNQTTWRQIQLWLDIGNDAHHGDFEKYTSEQVSEFHRGLANFITAHFS